MRNINIRGNESHPEADEAYDLAGLIPAVQESARRPGGLSPQARLEAIASILAVAALRGRLKKRATASPPAHIQGSSAAPRRRT